MKVVNANGDEKSLVLMGGDFKFYCLQLKNPVGETLEILVFFPVGMRVQCSFPMGMKFQGIFLTGETIFLPILPAGRGSHQVCDTGCLYTSVEKCFGLIH